MNTEITDNQNIKDLSFLLNAKSVRTMQISDILNTIPHREPFLFVNKVEVMKEHQHGVGIKNFSPDEYFFKGHFPGKPVVPGAIILEAMAQTCAALIMSLPQYKGKIAFFMGMNAVKFRKPVFPGQTVRLAVNFLRSGKKVGKAYCQAYIDSGLCAEAELTFAVSDN